MVVASGGGEAEIVGNDDKSGGMGTPLWVGDFFEVNKVNRAPLGLEEACVGPYHDPVGDGT